MNHHMVTNGSNTARHRSDSQTRNFHCSQAPTALWLSEATQAGVHPEAVRRLTRSRADFARIGRGLHCAALLSSTEHHTLAEVAKRVPNGNRFRSLTALLRFHGSGDPEPRDVWLAVDRRAGIPKIDFTPVRIIRMSGAALSAGIDERDVDGVRVRITSPARTVVDCFKFRNKIGIDVAVEAPRATTVSPRKGTLTSSWRQADWLAHVQSDPTVVGTRCRHDPQDSSTSPPRCEHGC